MYIYSSNVLIIFYMQSNLMYRIKDNNAKCQTYVMGGNGNHPTTIKSITILEQRDLFCQ